MRQYEQQKSDVGDDALPPIQNRPSEYPRAAVGTIKGMLTRMSSTSGRRLSRFLAMYKAKGMPSDDIDDRDHPGHNERIDEGVPERRSNAAPVGLETKT